MNKSEVTRREKDNFIRSFLMRTTAAFLSAVILAMAPETHVLATETTKKQLEEAKKAKEQSRSELEDTKDDIAEMNEEKHSLQGQLSNLNPQLTEVSNNLEEIEEQIVDKETEIENTLMELEVARAKEQDQYASMKKRIQFMYEKQDNMLMGTLFGGGSFANFLNQTTI